MTAHHRGIAAVAITLLLSGCPGDERDDDASGTDDDVTGDDDDGTPNAPPSAPIVAIEPASPSTYDDLVCSVVEPSVDPDGDPVSYDFRWEEGGEAQPGDVDTVSRQQTHEGDDWRCVVTATDGVDAGPPGTDTVHVGGPVPCAVMTEARIMAMGGEQGGLATVEYYQTYLDIHLDPLCSVTHGFEADYGYGTSQGVDFYGYADEILTWTSGQLVMNTCEEAWVEVPAVPVEAWRWDAHPMAFVSCERVGMVPSLAGTFVGFDDAGVLGVTDGTFADYCGGVAAQYQAALGTGAAEGVWLTPGVEAELDFLGSWGYFAPPNTANVEVWAVEGLLMNEGGNDELTIGLDGHYRAVSFWQRILHDCW